MVKTHKKSRIYRIAEKELKYIDGVVIQIEHIAEPVSGEYHCFVEVVPTEDYNSEMRHDTTLRSLRQLREEHEKLCDSIIRAFDIYKDAETTEIINREHLRNALEIAKDWLS